MDLAKVYSEGMSAGHTQRTVCTWLTARLLTLGGSFLPFKLDKSEVLFYSS